MTQKDLHNLKKEGWIEYFPKINIEFFTLDNIKVPTATARYFHKREGKLTTIRAIVFD